MSDNLLLYSHENKLLMDHLRNVADNAKQFIEDANIENLIISKNILSKVTYIIGCTHDFGKATSFFQKYLFADENLKKKLKNKPETRHSLISSLFTFFVIEKFLNQNGQKDAISKEVKFFLPVAGYLVVKRHHGNLKTVLEDFVFTHELDLITKQLDSMPDSEINKILTDLLMGIVGFSETPIEEFKRWVLEFINRRKYFKYKPFLRSLKRVGSLDYYFIIFLLYSALLDADKKDAANIVEKVPRLDLRPDWIDSYLHKKFNREGLKKADLWINELRREIYSKATRMVENIDVKHDRLFTLEAFTGAGKTLTVLSFALKLRSKIEQELGIKPRIIYSLPFLSIIDQNSDVLADVIRENKLPLTTNLLLKHHHLVEVTYRIDGRQIGEKTVFESEFEQFDIDKALLLIESWESEMVVTTFVQLFHSIITNRNRAIKKFHNIANSIIILDEIQAIPHKYWKLIHDTLLFLAEKFNVWIVLMTATLPLLFDKSQDPVVDLIPNSEQYYKALNRIEMNIDLSEKTLSEFQEQLLQDINANPNKDFLIIMNTIRSAREVYHFLREHLTGKNIEMFFLSTGIVPVSRQERIDAIRNPSTTKQKVIVSTQLVEAGVDISADVVYRDLAPLDSIIQSAGRCNRNGDRGRGRLNVVVLVDEENQNRRFCSYIYDVFLIGKTESILKKFAPKIPESKFYEIMKQYYKIVRDFMSDDESLKILGYLYNLEFSYTSDFKLIEEGYTYDVFIELNSEASKIRKEFEEIMLLDNSEERKKRWLALKNDFYKYVISVRSKEALQLPFLKNNLFIVENISLKDWYDEDMGFGRKINALLV